ncbi:DNA kinase/phosphatase Pnk1 [Blastocladiella emersonii ATCC 22665]|nr:DNA kinase/phosphatase Pnk1 [Blastocladiella emersonii ATCC 22665]
MDPPETTRKHSAELHSGPKRAFEDPEVEAVKRARTAGGTTAAAAERVEIHNEESLCVIEYMSPAPSSKIAAFSLDGTLITTKSGAAKPTADDDWELLYPDVVLDRLKELHASGFKIVVFANHRIWYYGRPEMLPGLQSKAIDIARTLGVPVQIFLSLEQDIYFKPRPGMWKKLALDFNADVITSSVVPIDVGASFFVGDVAGRPGDAWDTDRKFAINLGLPFHTPEEFFLGHPVERFHLRGRFDPSLIRELVAHEREDSKEDEEEGEDEDSDDEGRAELRYFDWIEDLIDPAVPQFGQQEVLVFTGSPASGKSTVAEWLRNSFGYRVVNQDTLGSLDACVEYCREYSHLEQDGKESGDVEGVDGQDDAAPASKRSRTSDSSSRRLSDSEFLMGIKEVFQSVATADSKPVLTAALEWVQDAYNDNEEYQIDVATRLTEDQALRVMAVSESKRKRILEIFIQ